MTTHEVLILAAGLYLGFVIAAVVHMVWVARDATRAARRAQVAATAAVKRTAGDRYLAAFQLDRLIHGRKERA
ncbi:hypothetical protein ABZS83_05135 [Streptomyces sp. NPDC005426]|uniref:hypothetical protein n=1 Tax=Streptomyces sp. NPDC005426 TaxID=3155344 RepID=UPI0033AD0F76